VSQDWKARIQWARHSYDMRRGSIVVRTELAQVFRRMLQTVIEPAFNEVAEFARGEGLTCEVACNLGGVQPRGMFVIMPSGRSLRFELDASGFIVREIEGVHNRALGQHMTWDEPARLQEQLTYGYARRAAASLVQEHFNASGRPQPKE
jgi:hypothetical protein